MPQKSSDACLRPALSIGAWFARRKLAIEVVQGDAQALPFDNHTFDAGVMALVITFVADPNKAVAEVARVPSPAE